MYTAKNAAIRNFTSVSNMARKDTGSVEGVGSGNAGTVGKVEVGGDTGGYVGYEMGGGGGEGGSGTGSTGG